MAKNISVSLTGEELTELNALVEASGLSRTDFIKNCCLPSRNAKIMFLNGAAILAKLSELYNYASSDVTGRTELYKLTDDIFEAFDELMCRIEEDKSDVHHGV